MVQTPAPLLHWCLRAGGGALDVGVKLFSVKWVLQKTLTSGVVTLEQQIFGSLQQIYRLVSQCCGVLY